MVKAERLRPPFKCGESMYSELKADMAKVMINNSPLNENQKQQRLNATFNWLSTTPKHTCLRVNTEKIDVETVSQKLIKHIKEETGREPHLTMEPKMPETILVHRWDETVKLDLNQYENEVIVDPTCGEFVLKGAPVYGPGIMAIPHGLNVGDKVSVFADITGSCLKGSFKFNDNSKVFLGNGILKQTRHSLFGPNLNVSGIAIEMTDLVSHLPQMNINELLKGEAIAQHLPCIICIYVLNPQPGELVLDMCAAPGNKTTHMSNYMKGKGRIIALDINKKRIKAIEEKCKDYCAENVKIFCCDAKKACTETNNLVEDGPPFNHNTFDKILLDPPCSGLGQRPQLLNKMTVPVLRSFKTLQQMLFKSAVRLLKPNGLLVYSTCTITVSENEEIVAWALQTFSCLKLVPVRERFYNEGYGTAGYSIEGLTEEQANCLYRFGPESDSIGFFIACFQKLSDQENS